MDRTIENDFFNEVKYLLSICMGYIDRKRDFTNRGEAYTDEGLTKEIKDTARKFANRWGSLKDSPLFDEITANIDECSPNTGKLQSYIIDLLLPFSECMGMITPSKHIKDLKATIVYYENLIEQETESSDKDTAAINIGNLRDEIHIKQELINEWIYNANAFRLALPYNNSLLIYMKYHTAAGASNFVGEVEQILGKLLTRYVFEYGYILLAKALKRGINLLYYECISGVILHDEDIKSIPLKLSKYLSGISVENLLNAAQPRITEEQEQMFIGLYSFICEKDFVEPQPKEQQPTETKEQRLKRLFGDKSEQVGAYLSKAVAVGLIKIDGDRYLWTETDSLLAVFVAAISRTLKLNKALDGNIPRVYWKPFRELFDNKDLNNCYQNAKKAMGLGKEESRNILVGIFGVRQFYELTPDR